MLSGRYRTDRLLRHFSDYETDGSCVLCKDVNTTGSIEHLLLHCTVLLETRSHLIKNLTSNTNIKETTKFLIKSHFHGSEDDKVQLILDPSVLPRVIEWRQNEGSELLHELFSFSRSWCYSIHKARMKLLGRWIKI